MRSQATPLPDESPSLPPEQLWLVWPAGHSFSTPGKGDKVAVKSLKRVIDGISTPVCGSLLPLEATKSIDTSSRQGLVNKHLTLAQ